MATVVPLDPDGSVATDVTRVDADGDVAGYFTDGSGMIHGFTLIGETYTTIDVPGASATFAEAINDDGVVAGTFRDSDGNYHGFIDDAGTFTTIDPPGALATDIEGINDAGEVVGFYSGTADFAGSTTGFTYSAGTYTTFGPPGGNTSVSNINASGQVAGWEFPPGSAQSQGFIFADGTLSTFDVTGATSVYTTDINASGQVVGYFDPGNGVFEGFVDNDGTIGTLAGPSGDSLYIMSENDAGTLVGYYVDSSSGNWIPYVDKDGVLTTLDMPAGASFAQARAITDAGYIYGTYEASPQMSMTAMTQPASEVQGDVVHGFVLACFAAGTGIATPAGRVPIETLRIGDAVCTHGGDAVPVKWIGRRSFDAATVAANSQLRPVRIRADALADGVPCRDLLVSPCHAVQVEENLIPAGALVNGASIIREAPRAIGFLHIELDRHALVYAEGVAAETFVDQDSRSIFENADECLAKNPASVPAASMKIIDSGATVEAARRRIAARAGMVERPARSGPLDGHVETVGRNMIEGWALHRDDPGSAVELEILIDDRRPIRVFANRYRADLDRAGLAGGRCSFRCRLSAPLRNVRVRRASDGFLLAVSPDAMARA